MLCPMLNRKSFINNLVMILPKRISIGSSAVVVSASIGVHGIRRKLLCLYNLPSSVSKTIRISIIDLNITPFLLSQSMRNDATTFE